MFDFPYMIFLTSTGNLGKNEAGESRDRSCFILAIDNDGLHKQTQQH